MAYPKIYLASTSPRRRELLNQIGVEFDTVTVQIDESQHLGESPVQLVRRLATDKARAGADEVQRKQLPTRPVLAADTIVVFNDSKSGDEELIFGKPKHREHAFFMLSSLSNQQHRVMSMVAVNFNQRILAALSTTVVLFEKLSPSQIDSYLDTGEPFDKAGGYGIQGRAAAFIKRIEGSYSGVMGLPLAETSKLLRQVAAS